MTGATGVPASPSGYSAEPEPSCTVSAVPVSIPNAVDLPIVKSLEGNVGSLTVGELWLAAGIIKQLYEACEAYEARIGDRDMGSEYLTSLVVAALAKARGEQA